MRLATSSPRRTCGQKSQSTAAFDALAAQGLQLPPITCLGHLIPHSQLSTASIQSYFLFYSDASDHVAI